MGGEDIQMKNLLRALVLIILANGGCADAFAQSQSGSALLQMQRTYQRGTSIRQNLPAARYATLALPGRALPHTVLAPIDVRVNSKVGELLSGIDEQDCAPQAMPEETARGYRGGKPAAVGNDINFDGTDFSTYTSGTNF